MTPHPIQSEEGGYRGIFRGEAEDAGTYFRGNDGSRVSISQKCEKNMSTTNAKIELWFEPELNFCTFWGLQNEPPKALRTPT